MSIKNSCKIAGTIEPQMSCEPCKIKLIFRGAKSDPFINDMKGSISFKGISLDVKKGITGRDTLIESTQDIGTLNWESLGSVEGYVHELTQEYKKSTYFFNLHLSNESLYFMNSFSMLCGQGKSKKLRVSNGMLGISHNQFEEKYVHIENGQKYLYIVVKIGLNITIDFDIDGVADADIYPTGEKQSLVVPIDHDCSYYGVDRHVALESISRGSNKFNKFFDMKTGSIDFKAVNYRTNVYTGNESNKLIGGKMRPWFYSDVMVDATNDIVSYLSGHNNVKVFTCPYTTGLSTQPYNVELIKNKVFILLETKAGFYSNTKYEFNQFKKEKPLIQDIKSFTKGKEIKIYQYEESEDGNDNPNRYRQFIFLHLVFDGKMLKYKDTHIDSTQFKENGSVKL